MKKILLFTLFCMAVIGMCATIGLILVKKDTLTTQKNIEKSIEVDNESTVVLSPQDESVKTEIAKYSDTTIDFRFNKQEKIEERNYNLTFSKIGCITSDDMTSNVTYKSDTGDEVSYDLETGNITMAYFHSLETEKTKDSIDLFKAEDIAYEFASKNCDIEKYVLEEKEERDNGYMISYFKQICGYRTNDRVRVLVGFDGSIVWTTIRLYAIDEQDVSVDENWFKTQIKKTEEDNPNIVIEDTWIERDGKSIYFCIKNTIEKDDYVSASVKRIEL